jgi:acetate kinase
LAVDLFVDRVLGFVGSYFVKLDGQVDALVFAGGIGEKGVEVRRRVVEGVRCLGFEIDEKKNKEVGNGGVVEEIGYQKPGSVGKKVLVVKTDEQLEMARGCVREFIGMEK